MHVSSMIWSLIGNYAASCRDLEQTLRSCLDMLPRVLLNELSRVLHHHNPSKFKGNVTVDQRKKSRAYDNHASVRKKHVQSRTFLEQRGTQQKSGCVALMSRVLLPRLIPKTTRFSVQRRKKGLASLRRIIQGNAFLYTHQRLHMNKRRHYTSLRCNNDKIPNPNVQHPDILPGQRHPALRR